MEDIAIIKELEKLLGIKSEEISPEDWNKFRFKTKKLNYSIENGNIERISVRSPIIKISSEIAFDLLSKVNALKYLDLSGNELETIPEAVFTLISLTNLNLSDNGLKQIPEAISKLTSLTSLDLSQNNLIEFPIVITKLTSLTNLIFSQKKVDPKHWTGLSQK